jgi:glycosyltransferase involved in cell wall biosynthesis
MQGSTAAGATSQADLVKVAGTAGRIFFVNRYFAPDQSATSQLLSQVACDLASAGCKVEVVTSRHLYDEPKARLFCNEIVDGVKVRRVASTEFGRKGLFGKSVDYACFYVMAYRILLRQVSRGDIIVAMTDPPLLSIVAQHVAARRGAKLINWLQDIYPEVAIGLGVPLLNGPIATALKKLRNRSLRRAQANVVLGDCMRNRVTDFGVADELVHVIPNWCRDEEIIPVEEPDNPLRKMWNLEGKFVVGYSGNLGRAHEYETMLSAAEALRNHPGFVFLFIGGGRLMRDLLSAVKKRGLAEKFLFLPYQQNSDLKFSLPLPNVHWISLRSNLEGLIVPSKFYGIAAAGRPIIAVTSATGEIARLVRQYDCGRVVEPGDSAGLVKTLAWLTENRERSEAMGRAARAMLEAWFTRKRALAQWRDLIAHLALPADRPQKRHGR